jgi:hypothetical protein
VELDVRQGGRSAMTLAVLAVVFLAGVAWAWSRVTEPFPEKVEAAPCTDTLIREGEEVSPPQVMVTVLNAGGANGLASKTMDQLVAVGFGKGDTGNGPPDTGPLTSQVWASDPGDPAAILLASYLGKDVEVVDRGSGYPGVTIVVGKRFKGVKQGRDTVAAQTDSYVCTPPLSSNPDDLG